MNGACNMRVFSRSSTKASSTKWAIRITDRLFPEAPAFAAQGGATTRYPTLSALQGNYPFALSVWINCRDSSDFGSIAITKKDFLFSLVEK